MENDGVDIYIVPRQITDKWAFGLRRKDFISIAILTAITSCIFAFIINPLITHLDNIFVFLVVVAFTVFFGMLHKRNQYRISIIGYLFYSYKFSKRNKTFIYTNLTQENIRKYYKMAEKGEKTTFEKEEDEEEEF